MSYTTEVILGMTFILVSMIILLGGIRNFSRSATDITVAEFERNKARWIALLCPVIGLGIIGTVLYRSRFLSADDEPYLHSLVIGVAVTLYGLYRGFQLKREK